MKVDVYPNINKVEVYENPISVPVDASWEKVLFTIEDANDTTFVLPSQPMLDRDGDFVLKVFYNAVLAEFSIDYSIDGSTITWLNRFPLEANELIEICYAPKSAYGSVPGSGEVTSLNHLNDVSIAGPITGQLLVRNNDGKFQNKSLIAGDNVTITNDNADITIASNPNLPLSHLSANGTLENNNAYVIDTSSAPITMQLPATSTLGKVISVQRLGGEQLTISRNGHNVNALAQDITVGDGETVTFRYLDATTGWLKSSSGLTSAGGNGAVQTSDGSGGLVDSGWTISSGHLLPSLNEQYDIGSATNLVRDIYLSNNSLKFGAEGKALSLNAQNKLEFDGTELASGSGIEGLSFSGTLSDGEVIKYNGTNWVNTPVDYTQVSNTPSLSAVATTGNYTDISGTPTLSDVATSGAYTDLTGTPSLATVATSGSYNDLDNRPSLFSGSYNDLTDKPSLFSGNYNDLTNLPSLFSGSYADLTNKPTLAAVATSGSYTDLTNKPTIPTDLNSLSDVSFTADASIDGYVLTYNHTNTQWEALQSTGSSSVAWDEVGQADSAVNIVTTVGDITIDAQGSDTDIVFQGTDGVNHVEMLRLDASEAGKATFNGDVNLKTNRKLLFGNAGDVSIEHVSEKGLNLKVNAGSGSTEPVFSLISENTEGTGPTLKLVHSNHDASFDTVGRIIFTGNTDASNNVDISTIKSVFVNRSDTAKHSQMAFQVYSNNSQRNALFLDPVTNSDATIFRILDHNGVDGGLKLGLTLVTASGDELNLLDGGTAVGASVTIADTDGILLSDAGIMKKIPASDLKTYIGSGTASNAISQGDSEVAVTDTGTDGNINFKTDNTSRWDITSDGHLIPASNSSYDIGSAEYKVRHLYLSDSSLKFVNSENTEFPLSVNASSQLVFNTAAMATEAYVGNQIEGLGTASTQDVGTSASNVVQLDASANIDVSSNDIVTASNADIDLVPNGTGKVTIHGNATSGSGQIKLNCEQNSHGIILKGPAHSAEADYTLTFPNALGSNNQVLKTDASGNLAWVDQASGGGLTYQARDTTTHSPLAPTANYHYSINANSANFVINLEALTSYDEGDQIRIKLQAQTSTYNVTINANGSDTIDGQTNSSPLVLSVLYQAVTLVRGATEWEVI